jgi:hypothetical protein
VAASVARKADVTASPGSLFYTGATSGAWTAGSVTVTTTDAARSDGAQVAVKASCTFSFAGSNGQTAVSGTSSVTLSPASRALTVGGTHPLVDGDSEKDSYGNTVEVTSGAALRTA